MSGFFDVPAGYSDADLEMARIEDLGARYARRFRGFTEDQVTTLIDGGAVTVTRWHGPKGERQSYIAVCRGFDVDEIGPCLEWSVDGGASWHETAKAARLESSVVS